MTKKVTSFDVPHAIWPTDNRSEIPVLDPEMQATVVPHSFKIWNFRHTPSRRCNNGGMYAFYTEDKEFRGLLRSPEKLINSRCAAIAELNLSLGDTTRRCKGEAIICDKREFSVLCQQFGIRIFVDLYVVPKFREINLLGVPKGWKAYATRGNTERFEELQEEFDLACTHAETSKILFVVYGGGRHIEQWCHQQAAKGLRVHHFIEMMDSIHLELVEKTLTTAAGTITYNVRVEKPDE